MKFLKILLGSAFLFCSQLFANININTATAIELETLNGIGKTKAEAIVAYREKNGQFTKIEDLMNVKGIGKSTFNKIKDEVTVETTKSEKSAESTQSSASETVPVENQIVMENKETVPTEPVPAENLETPTK